MCESGIFESACKPIEYASSYSMPEKYVTTSSAVLWRVRKAGKYFIIKTPRTPSWQSLLLLQREYEMSLGKSHPNIVNIFTFETDTVVGPGIVMEYIDGRTLTEFIAENPPPALRRRAFMQLLQAVGYIHRCGLVHNDIKPDNIIITRSDNDVRLIDFGLADCDACYLLRTLGCTPAYASPELLAQADGIDARSDIYSLGIIMKELLGNRYSRIARRCIRHDAKSRYSNADELVSAIRRSSRAPAVILLAIAAIAVSAPLLYIGNSMMQHRQDIAIEEKLLCRIEHDVDSIYAITADSLSRAVYFEFACNSIASFWTSLSVYNKEQISIIAPGALYSTAAAHYSKRVVDCHDKLWTIANSLPSYANSSLSTEEIKFYDTLVGKGVPYEPYKK